jgi:hypothetical protein
MDDQRKALHCGCWRLARQPRGCRLLGWSVFMFTYTSECNSFCLQHANAMCPARRGMRGGAYIIESHPCPDCALDIVLFGAAACLCVCACQPSLWQIDPTPVWQSPASKTSKLHCKCVCLAAMGFWVMRLTAAILQHEGGKCLEALILACKSRSHLNCHSLSLPSSCLKRMQLGMPSLGTRPASLLLVRRCQVPRQASWHCETSRCAPYLTPNALLTFENGSLAAAQRGVLSPAQASWESHAWVGVLDPAILPTGIAQRQPLARAGRRRVLGANSGSIGSILTPQACSYPCSVTKWLRLINVNSSGVDGQGIDAA